MDTVKDIGFGPAAEALYLEAVESLVRMWRQGAVGFDPSWTWQSPSYDRALVLEKECRYFTDAFLRGHLHLNVSFDRLAPDFFRLADRAWNIAVPVSCTGISSPATSWSRTAMSSSSISRQDASARSSTTWPPFSTIPTCRSPKPCALGSWNIARNWSNRPRAYPGNAF